MLTTDPTKGRCPEELPLRRGISPSIRRSLPAWAGMPILRSRLQRQRTCWSLGPDEGSVSRGAAVATRDLSQPPTKLACLGRDAHPEEPPSATKDLLVSRTRQRVGVPSLPSLSPRSRRCDEGISAS